MQVSTMISAGRRNIWVFKRVRNDVTQFQETDEVQQRASALAKMDRCTMRSLAP